ncbi:MAG: hypothetical protein JW951_05645 [Lentisphaerae bacterium]|nr:hypothetical protein [Lentisphaerota bacterium]
MDLLHRKTAVERRLKKVRRELSLVDDDIRTLKRCVDRPEKRARVKLKTEAVRAAAAPVSRRPAGAARGGDEAGPRAEPGPRRPAAAGLAPREPRGKTPFGEAGRDRGQGEWLSDYLASSLEPMRPLRHERHVQRNKAIVMLVVVVLALFWVLYRFVWL